MSLFPQLDIDRAVQTIHNQVVFQDIRLPLNLVHEIVEFCRSEQLFARFEPDKGSFRHGDIISGYRPRGYPTPIGVIQNPASHPAVRAITEDTGLRSLVRKYLGYEPSQVMTLLYWSFASDFSDDERRRMKQHFIDYHYDVDGYNALYASFYLFDTSILTGAHVMVKSSHRGKSLAMLWDSAVSTPEKLYQHFARENELVIEGPAGTGFIENPFCYHRAYPPVSGDRLLLQIRFS